MIKCNICNKDFNTAKQLIRHVKDYLCGKPTNYKSFTFGYYKTCSHICHAVLQNKSYSIQDIDRINQKRKIHGIKKI